MKHENPGHPIASVHTEVEFDNEHVRVVRFHFQPHAKVPMHEAPELVSIALTDGHLRLNFPDGTFQDFHYQAGDANWSPAQSHAGENMGDTPLEFVAVQLKQ